VIFLRKLPEHSLVCTRRIGAFRGVAFCPSIFSGKQRQMEAVLSLDLNFLYIDVTLKCSLMQGLIVIQVPISSALCHPYADDLVISAQKRYSDAQAYLKYIYAVNMHSNISSNTSKYKCMVIITNIIVDGCFFFIGNKPIEQVDTFVHNYESRGFFKS
jgi:hypothetical protein